MGSLSVTILSVLMNLLALAVVIGGTCRYYQMAKFKLKSAQLTEFRPTRR